ncbi:TonB-dependent receptor [Sphingomonas sp.]|uniref:TonB-dependent receptor n=1 Tax=Sphingomonas sp. TaxID=28214 RepID=UPI003D6D5D0A
MVAATLDGMDFGHRRRTRGRRGARWLVVAGLALAGLIVAVTFLRGITVTERPNEMKTTRVILPPPPPPPPPPEVKPEEKPPEPKPAPIEQPVTETPPPPTPDAAPDQGNNALTAREGAGPSNYGLAVGNGGGTRIGGKTGGNDGFAAYASIALADIRRAAQGDAALSRGRYTVRLVVGVSSDGRIQQVNIVDGSGDTRRDAAIERRLMGLQLSRRPPAGLPVMRIEFNTRNGA